MDHGKSTPNAGVTERSKNHGFGYPHDEPSIERSKPNGFGISDHRGAANPNEHGHTYPGRAYPGKGAIKNKSPRPSKHSKNIVG